LAFSLCAFHNVSQTCECCSDWTTGLDSRFSAASRLDLWPIQSHSEGGAGPLLASNTAAPRSWPLTSI